ncbi:MAG TPA: DUF6661 family protein [Mobilitalea sp.]|nr:DUF6661 family protein [Mobilitalea sp.]
MDIIESGIRFRFPETARSIKYDETKFYKDIFQNLPDAKGVDFISIHSNNILIMEVKNCKGYEAENRWRIFKNNAKVSTAAIIPEGDRDSVDIEIAKKVAMTLSCLIGAHSKPDFQEKSDVLKPFFRFFEGKFLSRSEKEIRIVLFLEGDFASDSRSEKMILHELGESIEQKLSWLNCKVLVENSNTYRRQMYEVV